MALSPGLCLLPLLLLRSLNADSEVKEVRAVVGGDAELSCVFHPRNHFDLSELYVYWQISGPDTVVTYYIPENSSEGHEDPRYKNRAHLSLDRMKQGDFSLHLQNITLPDAQNFTCLVIKKPLMSKLWEEVVRLRVAANFSVPIVSTPSKTSQDQELTFTCMSTDGYPRPNVYWINRTDNSLLDQAWQNHTVFLNERGLFDVVSVLRVPWAHPVDVGCCIENVLLHQNLTGSSQTETLTGNKDRSTKNPESPHEENSVTLYSTLSVLLGAAVVAFAWVCRRKCSPGCCTGPQAAMLKHEPTGPQAAMLEHEPTGPQAAMLEHEPTDHA